MFLIARRGPGGGVVAAHKGEECGRERVSLLKHGTNKKKRHDEGAASELW